MSLKMKNNSKIHILGGGPAGVATSYYASQKKINSVIYEASSAIGGNCKTIKLDDFYFDLGAHRFHDKNENVTNEIKKILGNQLLKVHSPSKIFYKNNYLDFPLRIFNVLTTLKMNIGLKIVYENFLNQLKTFESPNTFEEVAYQNYGKTLSNLFLMNYTEKLWGESSNKLLPSIAGGRLKNLNLKSIIAELFFNQKSGSKHLDGEFWYPKFGFGTIFESMKNSPYQEFFLNSSVTRLIHDGKKITKIEINQSNIINVNQIVSTLPINLLIKFLYPVVDEKLLMIANSLKFRGLKLCVLMLDRPYFSDNASIYFPDKKIPFTRIYEPKNRSKFTAPNDKTCIVAEVPYKPEKSNINNQELLDQIVSILGQKKMLKKSEVLTTKVYDLPFAYPILDLEVKEKLNILFKFLSRFKNLHLIGRNANFEYQHTHDIFKNSNYLIEKISKN